MPPPVRGHATWLPVSQRPIWTPIPIVAITGQVPTFLLGNDAFQESDITGITMPVTKHNYLVKNPCGPPEDHAGGILYRADRQAGPGAHRHPERREHEYHQISNRYSGNAVPAGVPADLPRAPEADRKSDGNAHNGRTAPDLCRRGNYCLECLRRTGAAGRTDDDPGHDDPDGTRGDPLRSPAQPRDARDARNRICKFCRYRMRLPACPRGQVRRQGDGKTRYIRIPGPDHSYRYRSCGNRKEQVCRYSHRRRFKGRSRGNDPETVEERKL